jgi:predicted dehydrogenase
MYAEELCFTPKYVRVKQLAEEGAFGKVYLVKQSEKHNGPHAGWFWDVRRSGGGVTMDMGCHAIEFFRWFYGKPKAVSVMADMGTFVHADKTVGTMCTIIVRLKMVRRMAERRAGHGVMTRGVFGPGAPAIMERHSDLQQSRYGYVVEGHLARLDLYYVGGAGTGCRKARLHRCMRTTGNLMRLETAGHV